ncbi:hypothetical protein L195_g034961 [Trifolium pratense]|uniref:Uncharacterized protein n=1 Tax=Trifolium pratense TaxID=57577 RepID=A0A2K3LKA6_TRIPR|nr:hypothetical protein L195_g034961 [Trifolium pratense]
MAQLWSSPRSQGPSQWATVIDGINMLINGLGPTPEATCFSHLLHTLANLSVGAPAGRKPPSHSPERKMSTTGQDRF